MQTGKNEPGDVEQEDKLHDLVKQQKQEIFRLKSVIGNLPGSIYWKDKDGIYLGRNTYSMEKMIIAELEQAGSRDDILGKTDYDIFLKEVADRYRKHDLKVMETGEELILEEPVSLLNGETIIQLSTKRPLYDEKGQVVGVVGNTVDITYLKKIENELRTAKEKAEEANKVKTEFMRNMEHDIRTPFNGIWGLANHLHSTETDPERKKYLNDIVQCSKELVDYCNGIFDFSKVESGMQPVIEKKFNLYDLAASVTKIELPAAEYKTLPLNFEFDPAVPAVLIGDEYRISRILINLLSNAIKFTEKGSIKLKVLHIQSHNREVLIRFIVEDTGIGIPREKQEFIFERFSRLEQASKGTYKGMGLGLRIVKQFMFELGGEIDLVSEVGKGTQFICTIPFVLPLTNDFIS